jgi:hypothetical protein
MRKLPLLHEYSSKPSEILVASRFDLTEHFYLSSQRRFTLTKVPKLRPNVTDRVNDKIVSVKMFILHENKFKCYKN